MKFELNLRKRDIPEDELLADLKKVASIIKKDTVTAKVYTEKGKFGVNTFLRRFGSWNNALNAAGLKVVLNLNIEEELFENLADVWQHLGRQPVGKDMEKSVSHSKYSLRTYEKRFGSWNKALEAFIEYINTEIKDMRSRIKAEFFEVLTKDEQKNFDLDSALKRINKAMDCV